MLRHQRRSLLATSAIIIGVAASIFLIAFCNGLVEAILRDTIDTNLGALQVQGALTDEVLTQVRALPGVEAASPRLTFSALLNNGEGATLAVGAGIEPDSEYRVCPNLRRIQRVPLDGRQGEAAVGYELAAAMGLGAGRAFSLQASTERGQPNALDFVFKGAVDIATNFLGQRLVLLPLEDARRLLGVRHSSAIGVRVPLDQIDTVKARIAGMGLAVLRWDEVNTNAAQFLYALRVVLIGVCVALAALGLLGIAATTLLGLAERTGELGTLMAFGMRRRALLRLLLTEAALLGVGGVAIGLMLGGAVVGVMHGTGYTMAFPPGPPLTVYPMLSLAEMAAVAAAAIACALLAALIPAYRTSQRAPVDALRS